jgi:organic radical activating enzyme
MTSVNDNNRDYYCSMKFRFLKLDLELQTTYTCHAATPHRIDFPWLSNNQGNLFNNPINIVERQLMLDNQRAPSCEQNCWYAEDHGMQSPRITQKGTARTHEQLYNQPEILDITIGKNCNLTCSYCCKEFSSAWANDLNNNGSYNILDEDTNRYQLTAQDKLLLRAKQLEISATDRYKMLLDEIRVMAPNLKKLTITGGEPFLNNQLVDLLDNIELPKDTVVHVFSGLGVNPTRFERMLDKIASKVNLLISVSAEGIQQHLEFNRYGVTWNQFLSNIDIIKKSGAKYKFHCTLTNLTVFGFANFYDYFRNDEKLITFAYQPRMMAVNVLDDQSKQHLCGLFSKLESAHEQILVSNMMEKPSDIQRNNIATFLTEFVKRRPTLNLNIYPRSFLNWLNIKNVV